MTKQRKTWIILGVVGGFLFLIAVEIIVAGLLLSRTKQSRQARANSWQQSPGRQDQQRQQRWPNEAPPPVQAYQGGTAARSPSAPVKPTGPRAAAPEFTVAGGVFTKGVTVTLQTKATNAVIRYTLNSIEPDERSEIYSAPIAISQSTVVQARAFEPGLAYSPTAAQTYTMLDSDLASFNSNLPLVILETFGHYVSHDSAVPISARFIRPVNGRAALTGPADYDGRGDLKQRGFTSLRQPKQSFTFKSRDDGDKVDAALFGMPEESDWVLYAPYSDKTLMRDALAYELAGQMGRYAPRTRFVEAFVNRAGGKLSMQRDYVGVYVLIEKIKRDKNRVNIHKLGTNDNTEPNISGGYIFKRDHDGMPWGGGGFNRNVRGQRQVVSSSGEQGFSTASGLQLFFVDPKGSDLTAPQKQWLATYMSRFERALQGSNFADPAEGYAKYLDADSFIDHFWLVEATKNIDGFRYSCFLTKDRGGKLKVEPPWDWNLSFGNADYYDAYETTGWYYTLLRDSEISWFNRLDEDPEFHQKHIDRWAELRRTVFQPEAVCRRVDEMAAQLNEAQARNFNRWRILGREVKPNYYVGATWQAELDWMKNWIRQRIAWIDSQYPAAPTLSEKSGPLPPDAKLAIKANTSVIYYTIDGSDPRVAGGGVSGAARRYESPLTNSAPLRLVARAKRGNAWSGPVRGEFTASAKK